MVLTDVLKKISLNFFWIFLKLAAFSLICCMHNKFRRVALVSGKNLATIKYNIYAEAIFQMKIPMESFFGQGNQSQKNSCKFCNIIKTVFLRNTSRQLLIILHFLYQTFIMGLTIKSCKNISCKNNSLTYFEWIKLSPMLRPEYDFGATPCQIKQKYKILILQSSEKTYEILY